MMSSLRCKDNSFLLKYGQAAYSNLFLIVHLIQICRTVNLNHLKQRMPSILGKKGQATTQASHYKRLNRFFQSYGDNPEFFEDSSLLLAQMLHAKGHRVLLLDGTKWDLDGGHLHYLVLSVLVRGVSIPIYFIDLEKAGASSQEERIAFIKKVLGKFNIVGMTLLADREYVGEDWFKSLVDNGLNFVIRLKKGDYEVAYNEMKGANYEKAWAKCLNTGKVSAKEIKLLSIPYSLVMCQNRDIKAADKTVFLLSNLKGKKTIAQTYLLRWKIERMFKQLKSEGYNIEAINLKTAGRRCLLILAACIAFAMTVDAALGKYKKFKTIIREDGKEHLVQSVFQIGLELMAKHTINFKEFMRYVEKKMTAQNLFIKLNV